MKVTIWLLVLLVIVLHQDVWNWHRTALTWGVLPVGLVYHMGLSLATALVWYLATRYAWPAELDEEESTP